MIEPKRTWVVLFVCLLLLGVSSCGSSEDSSDGPDPSPEAEDSTDGPSPADDFTGVATDDCGAVTDLLYQATGAHLSSYYDVGSIDRLGDWAQEFNSAAVEGELADDYAVVADAFDEFTTAIAPLADLDPNDASDQEFRQPVTEATVVFTAPDVHEAALRLEQFAQANCAEDVNFSVEAWMTEMEANLGQTPPPAPAPSIDCSDPSQIGCAGA